MNLVEVVVVEVVVIVVLLAVVVVVGAYNEHRQKILLPGISTRQYVVLEKFSGACKKSSVFEIHFSVQSKLYCFIIITCISMAIRN